jgi:hypothetical protein
MVFIDDAQLDADNPTHVKWVHDAAMNRADEYGIRGINYRLVQGVLKRIIPAVASTNAIIAGNIYRNLGIYLYFQHHVHWKLSNWQPGETMYLMYIPMLCFSFAKQMNNYLNFNNVDGIYMGVVALDKLVCFPFPIP